MLVQSSSSLFLDSSTIIYYLFGFSLFIIYNKNKFFTNVLSVDSTLVVFEVLEYTYCNNFYTA